MLRLSFHQKGNPPMNEVALTVIAFTVLLIVLIAALREAKRP
jgi:hypothetical protein